MGIVHHRLQRHWADLCRQRTQETANVLTFCSFNSVLAKIINTQGKPQLGLDVSNCAGLSMEQLGQLDFTKIDFSEFSSQMLDRAAANTPTDMKTNYTPVMSTTTGGSQQGGSTVLPSYRK